VDVDLDSGVVIDSAGVLIVCSSPMNATKHNATSDAGVDGKKKVSIRELPNLLDLVSF
jgi:hypothetical protein